MPRDRRPNEAIVCELTDLEDALACAGIVAEALATDQLATEEDVRRAPRAVASVLRLVGRRLRSLRASILEEPARSPRT